MKSLAELLLLGVVLADLYALASGRVRDAIRASAAQGVLLAPLPYVLHASESGAPSLHLVATAIGTLALKGVVIPLFLTRALRRSRVRNDVEPFFVSLNASLFLGALLVGLGFWMGKRLPLPVPAATPLLVPVALSTVLIGFLVLVARRKAVMQVVGYLLLENGVFLFGLLLVGAMPFVVEAAVLLDILVGVFVMGITIHQISLEFDHMNTDALDTLKD